MENDIDATNNLSAPAAGVRQKPRVKDAKKVRDLIVSEEKHLNHRLAQYAAVTDSYDRVPMDTQAELQADGLGWTTNVNWGGMEAGIDEAVAPLFNLMTEPDTFVTFLSRLDMQGKHTALSALAKLDSEMVRDWDSHIDVAQQMLHNRVSFGLGIIHWPTPHGWHYNSLHPGNLITPERSPLNPSLWPWAAVKTEFVISDLIKKLGHAAEAKGQGWDTVQIKKALAKYREGSGVTWPKNQDIDSIVHGFMRNQSFGQFENSITIKGYILYNKEWDGSISEHYLTNQEGVGFLFSRKKHHASMDRMISVFPHSLGDGFLNRSRGYGIKMLPYHDTEDRTLNHMIDVTTLASNINLKGDQDDINRLAEIVFGPITLIPADFDIDQVSFSNTSGGLAQVRREIQQQRAGNGQVFGGAIDVSPNVDQTATGAKMRYQEQSKMAGYEVVRFYQQLGRFHRARWDRVTDTGGSTSDPGMKEAKELFKLAKGAGIPPELINSIHRVKAKTLFGDGDPVNQFLALMDLKEFTGNFSAQGKRVYSKLVVSSRLRNADLSDELHGEPGMDDLDTEQRRMAQLENGLFQVSDARIDIAGNDHHIIHAGEHTVFAEDTMEQIKAKQISEEQAYTTLQRARAHTIPHLEQISEDPQGIEIFKDLQRRWAGVENTLRQLGQHLEAKRGKEQEQQLEELRHPKLSVEEIESQITARAQRDNLAKESEAKVKRLDNESDAKVQSIAKTVAGQMVADQVNDQ